MTSITSALQVWHPEFSAEKIQDILNISPQISYSVGDEIVRPNGEKLEKKHRTSYLCYDILPLQSELDLEGTIEKCNDFISCNIKNKDLFKIITVIDDKVEGFQTAVATRVHEIDMADTLRLDELLDVGFGESRARLFETCDDVADVAFGICHCFYSL